MKDKVSFFQVVINSPFYMIQYSDGKKVAQVSAKKVFFGRFYAKESTQFQTAELFKCFSLFTVYWIVSQYILYGHERVGTVLYLFVECSKVLRAEHFRNR